MKKSLIIIIAILVVIVGGIFYFFFNSGKPMPSITINSDHQLCTVDDDCTTVGTSCSCSCPEPVNKKYGDDYFDQLSEACEGYRGMMCGIECDFTVACEDGVCTKQETVQQGITNNTNINTNAGTITTTNTATDNTNSIEETKEECETLGGRWGAIGLSRTSSCNLPTSDGGKSCENNTDCTAGLCLPKPTDEERELLEINGSINILGTCPNYMIVVGCYNTIKDGVIMEDSVLCID